VSTQLSEHELQIVVTHLSLNEKHTSSSTLVSRRQLWWYTYRHMRKFPEKWWYGVCKGITW